MPRRRSWRRRATGRASRSTSRAASAPSSTSSPRPSPSAAPPRAKEFRKHCVELELAGATLVGVSTDDRDTQCRFATSLSAPFPLLGDNDKAISRAYDVLWPLIGLAHRVTYIVGPPRAVAPAATRGGRSRRSSATSSTSRPTGTRSCASSTRSTRDLDLGRALGRMRGHDDRRDLPRALRARARSARARGRGHRVPHAAGRQRGGQPDGRPGRRVRHPRPGVRRS